MSDDKNDKLVKMNLPERTLAVKELAVSYGKRADSALAAIAHVEGDQSAIQILQGLNPIEIGQILKAHDLTVPAISAWLADPEKLVTMLVMDPLDWESMLLDDNILEIQNNALSLLAQLILSTEDENRHKDILKALAANENSFFYMCLPFIGYNPEEKEETSQNDGPDAVADGDNESFIEPLKAMRPSILAHDQLAADLMAVIEEIEPSLAERIKKFITVEDDVDNLWLSVRGHIADLRANAQKAINKSEGDDDDYETMFEKPGK